jgi:hypothetical protein
MRHPRCVSQIKKLYSRLLESKHNYIIYNIVVFWFQASAVYFFYLNHSYFSHQSRCLFQTFTWGRKRIWLPKTSVFALKYCTVDKVHNPGKTEYITSLIRILQFPASHRVPQAVCSLLHVHIDISFTSVGNIVRRHTGMLPMAETKKRSPLERNVMQRKSSVLRGHWDRQTAGFSVQVIACVVRCVLYSEQKETSASDD